MATKKITREHPDFTGVPGKFVAPPAGLVFGETVINSLERRSNFSRNWFGVTRPDKESDSRQSVRARLRSVLYASSALGTNRKDRRKLARALAAGRWRSRFSVERKGAAA
jgi:hypothetical protein